MSIFVIRKSKIQEFGDYWLSITAVVQSLLLLLQTLLGDSGFVSIETAALFRTLFSALFVGIAMIWICKRRFMLFYLTYAFILLIFFISSVIDIDNWEYIKNEGFKLTLATNIPIFLSYISIINKAIFKRVCLFTALISVILGIIYAILFLTSNLPMLESLYNMSFGYSLLLPLLFLIYFKQNKILIFFLVLIILIAGSRGPLIPIIAYILYRVIKYNSIYKQIVLVFLVVFFVSLTFPILLSYMDSIGVTSRTLLLLVEGSFDSDAGRGEIYEFIWSHILQKPFWGHGVFSDRVLLGIYCHNIILEFLLDFGLLISAFVFLVFFIVLIKLFKVISDDEKNLLVLLFLASVVPLLASSSYLLDSKFPLFLAFFYVLLSKYMKSSSCRISVMSSKK